jgi:hypothetical protein
MGLLRDENALYQRKVTAKLQPAVDLLANQSTVGTRFWISVLITDENNVSVTDATAAYDLNDLKTIVDGISDDSSDAGVVIAKDSEGVVSIST